MADWIPTDSRASLQLRRSQPQAGWLYRMTPAGAGPVEFITTGEGHEQVSYRTLDLANLPDA